MQIFLQLPFDAQVKKNRKQECQNEGILRTSMQIAMTIKSNPGVDLGICQSPSLIYPLSPDQQNQRYEDHGPKESQCGRYSAHNCRNLIERHIVARVVIPVSWAGIVATFVPNFPIEAQGSTPVRAGLHGDPDAQHNTEAHHGESQQNGQELYILKQFRLPLGGLSRLISDEGVGTGLVVIVELVVADEVVLGMVHLMVGVGGVISRVELEALAALILVALAALILVALVALVALLPWVLLVVKGRILDIILMRDLLMGRVGISIPRPLIVSQQALICGRWGSLHRFPAPIRIAEGSLSPTDRTLFLADFKFLSTHLTEHMFLTADNSCSFILVVELISTGLAMLFKHILIFQLNWIILDSIQFRIYLSIILPTMAFFKFRILGKVQRIILGV